MTTDDTRPLSAEDVEKVRGFHVGNDPQGIVCNCGMFVPCHARRLIATLDAERARHAVLVAAVEREDRRWLRHSSVWTDEEVGSVIDRIRAALASEKARK